MYLPLRPGILGTAPRVQPAFITDTDTRRIVPLGMRPDLLHRTGRHNPPVLPDIEVVSRPVESPPAMADIQIELRKTIKSIFLILPPSFFDIPPTEKHQECNHPFQDSL